MRAQSLTMRLAATLAIAAAAAGIGDGMAAAAGGEPRALDMKPAVFNAPVPLAPTADVPTADQVVSLLSGIADPNVPASNKSELVEDGLGPIERSVMDGRMKKGMENGKLPLTISADNIQPAGAGAATADVTASSAKLTPRSVTLRFVDRDGWKLSHSSLKMLSQMSSN